MMHQNNVIQITISFTMILGFFINFYVFFFCSNKRSFQRSKTAFIYILKSMMHNEVA